jgi:hypothetical protein
MKTPKEAASRDLVWVATEIRISILAQSSFHVQATRFIALAFYTAK